MAESGKEQSDELLEKLDQLFKRHRGAGEASTTEPTPDASASPQDGVPVLTDAVSGPAIQSSSAAPNLAEFITNRLAAALSREIGRLQSDLSIDLASLHATLASAVRLLVRRHVGAQAADTPAEVPAKPEK
jgi:hypothetical protein